MQTTDKSQIVSKALGQIVGLLLMLYVFDQILSAILPMVYNCPAGYVADTATQVCDLIANHSQPTVAIQSYFAGAIPVAQALLSPIGILGAFFVIWNALKRMELV